MRNLISSFSVLFNIKTLGSSQRKFSWHARTISVYCSYCSCSCSHGRQKRGGGMQGIWHPNYLCGDIDMYIRYIPLEKPNTYSHANSMQHVLRCWERQSDGSYKKTLRRPGLRPGPRWGSLQRSCKPPSWWGWAGCRLPKNPIPRSRHFGPRLSYPPFQN